MPQQKPKWLAIRQELPRNRQRLLVSLSFLLPIAAWCFLSYTPGVWHPFMKIAIGARIQSGEAVTVFAVNQKVPREYFDLIRQQINTENAKLLQETAEEPTANTPTPAATGLAAMIAQKRAAEAEVAKKRNNLVLMRQIAPIAIANEWLEPLADNPSKQEQDAFDREMIAIWQSLAEGALSLVGIDLSEANKLVIDSNWERMIEGFGDLDAIPTGDLAGSMPTKPLLRLLPEGKPANPSYLPAPHEVWISGIKQFQEEPKGDAPSMTQRLIQSVSIVFYGFAIAALFGVPLAVLAGTYDLFSKLFEPFIDFFRYMPAPAFSLALVAMFGSYDAPKISLVVVGTFFQLVLVVANTTRTLDAALIEAGRTLGAKGQVLLMRVIVPGVLPKLYTDLRILLGWAWTWLVIAELIGVKSGLTEVIDTQGTYRNFDRVYPVIILIGIIGFATDQALQAIARKLFPYAYEQRPGLIQRIIATFASKTPATA